MRRQNEVIPSSQQHSTTVSASATATGSIPSTATPSPPLPVALPHTAPAALSLAPPTPTPSAASVQDSLNTPTTPLVRAPLQFTTPPVPPPIVASAPGNAFTYYNNNVGVATSSSGQPSQSYLHHSQAVATKPAGSETGVELDEYVDILQVQQLLLDSSAAAAASAGNPTQEQQQPQQEQSLQPLAKPRPRINLQKASEYAAQLAQGKSAPLLFACNLQQLLTLFHSSRDIFSCLASRTARLSESLFVRQPLPSNATKRGPCGPLVWQQWNR